MGGETGAHAEVEPHRSSMLQGVQGDGVQGLHGAGAHTGAHGVALGVAGDGAGRPTLTATAGWTQRAGEPVLGTAIARWRPFTTSEGGTGAQILRGVAAGALHGEQVALYDERVYS